MKKSLMPGSTAQKAGACQEPDGRQVRLKALNLSLELQDGPLQVADRNGFPTGSSNINNNNKPLSVERKKEEES